MATDRMRAMGPLAAERKRRRRAWLAAGGSVAALVTVVTFLGRSGKNEGHHPTPREPEVRSVPVAAAEFASYPRVTEAYRMAAAVPEILDGLYCHCACAEHSGHYSLLDCFASDHGAHCDVCMSEAVIAYRMAQQGAPLDQIRDAVDRMYGT